LQQNICFDSIFRLQLQLAVDSCNASEVAMCPERPH